MPAKPILRLHTEGLRISEPDEYQPGKTHVALTMQVLVTGRRRKSPHTERWDLPNGVVKAQTPHLLTPWGGRDYWLHLRKAYVTFYPGLTPAEVKLLLTAMRTDQEDRRRADLDRALALAAMVATPLPDPNRPAIPVEVKRFVWQRDGGRCVLCGGTTDLQFGHIIPFSWGGSNTEVNLQLECAGCNLSKGADL